MHEFEYVDVDGEESGAPKVTKKELLEEGMNQCNIVPSRYHIYIP